jgi:hypothetical protein
MAASAALSGIIAWRLNLQSIEGDIKGRRAALKKLVLSGGIPPNQEVMDYLSARQAFLDQRYQSWVKTVDAAPLTEAAKADPQLYFQEQFHEVQRALERLAAARGIAVPEQLGFPKEIPPSDTVLRLLGQLSLIREAAGLILEQGVTTLSSLKVEDPEAVSEEGGDEPFLVRLPVRVRLTSSLSQLMKILGAMEGSRPFIDVRALHVVSGDASGSLDVDLLLARYLVMAPAQEPAPPAEAKQSAAQKKTSAPRARKPRQAGASKPQKE